jgi:hypothetical protein
MFEKSPRRSQRLMVLAVAVFSYFVVVPSIDSIYRKTLGKYVLATRITHVIGDKMYTDFGELSLISIVSDRRRASEFQMQVRLGCKYEMVISDGLGDKLKMYFGNSPGLLHFEYIVRGINEPAIGCGLLYNSVSLVGKKEQYERKMSILS